MSFEKPPGEPVPDKKGLAMEVRASLWLLQEKIQRLAESAGATKSPEDKNFIDSAIRDAQKEVELKLTEAMTTIGEIETLKIRREFDRDIFSLPLDLEIVKARSLDSLTNALDKADPSQFPNQNRQTVSAMLNKIKGGSDDLNELPMDHNFRGKVAELIAPKLAFEIARDTISKNERELFAAVQREIADLQDEKPEPKSMTVEKIKLLYPSWKLLVRALDTAYGNYATTKVENRRLLREQSLRAKTEEEMQVIYGISGDFLRSLQLKENITRSSFFKNILELIYDKK